MQMLYLSIAYRLPDDKHARMLVILYLSVCRITQKLKVKLGSDTLIDRATILRLK